MTSHNIDETGASLLEILEEITGLVENAKAMPLSASVLVNRSEILDLLNTARDIVPSQIVAADSVLQDAAAVSDEARERAEEIVDQANQEADQILAEAREQASRLVSQDSITIAAKSQSARILDEAKSKADRVKRGADEYSDAALEHLAQELVSIQNELDTIQHQIAAGRGLIADRRDDDVASEAYDEHEDLQD
ncbi:cell division septum initiation protein DivIVA [Arcanobacterium pluranimalium]|uniref:hypothetical protein n=1 Tax=Arcanobacterium pluranimalium TaxID=108028 RepID=UPI00195ED202|nr:hypothetical protein [Arcanobacterium pluranimalium]MBM7825219.1 cell division septum initiation protein DivIVA [Arcanobacterium pluranimalium]